MYFDWEVGNGAMNRNGNIAVWFQLGCDDDFTSFLDNCEVELEPQMLVSVRKVSTRINERSMNPWRV